MSHLWEVHRQLSTDQCWKDISPPSQKLELSVLQKKTKSGWALRDILNYFQYRQTFQPPWPLTCSPANDRLGEISQYLQKNSCENIFTKGWHQCGKLLSIFLQLDIWIWLWSARRWSFVDMKDLKRVDIGGNRTHHFHIVGSPEMWWK